MGKLQGAVMVVTGGGGGIGRELCRDGARRGARLVVSDISADKAEAVARELRDAGAEAVAAACDVSEMASVEALARRATEAFGGVNLFFGNAGVGTVGDLETISPQDFRWIMEVNVFGAYHAVRSFTPLLREAARRGEFAHLAITGSEHALGVRGPETSSYTGSKHALLGFTDGMRSRLAQDGIGVSLVCPGRTATEVWDAKRMRPARFGGPEAAPEAMKAIIGTGQDPRGVAAAALDAIEAGEFLIALHPETRHGLGQRIALLQAALRSLELRLAGGA